MNHIRCEVCGKFISYKELDKNQIIIDFTPDTEYTTEQTLFTHKKCIKDGRQL